jgi:hypothetical protein
MKWLMQKQKLFLVKQISFGTIGMHTVAILIQHMFHALDEQKKKEKNQISNHQGKVKGAL